MQNKQQNLKKLYILPIFSLTLFLAACGSKTLSPQQTTPVSLPEGTTAEPVTPVETTTSEPTQPQTTSTSLTEEALIEIMQKACGSDLQTYLYLDMDNDGQKELLGTFAPDNMSAFQTWFASSDGTICKEVLRSSMTFDECAMEAIPLEHETHVAVNTYNLMGTSKFHSILALQNSEIICLDENSFGYIGADDNGNIFLSIEDYDGMYDPDIQVYMTHTWKRTYLTYDKTQKTYKEYTAKQISEEEFLKLKNAKECLETIRAEHTKENTKEIQFSFFIRKNGILHVQCNEYDTAGFIYYSYYTMQYQGDTILDAPGEQNDGQMSESFSQFEAVE